MLNTYLSDQPAKGHRQSIDRIGKQPLVDRETKYYLDNITKVKTVDDFVSDSRLFKYAMKAFGLGDMDYAKAFMAKALKEGVEDPDSFANKLSDKRYAEFVRTFNSPSSAMPPPSTSRPSSRPRKTTRSRPPSTAPMPTR